MNSDTPPSNRRILIVDDNPTIHEAFGKILAPKQRSGDLAEAEAALFDEALPAPTGCTFELVSAYHGDEALVCVRQALAASQPFALAFVDIRMPPGPDGIETTLKLWEADPALQVVICTAYSDYSFDDMAKRLGQSDRVLILKKPFDVIEAQQLACSLTEKWRLSLAARSRLEELDAQVVARTGELREANERLCQDLAARQRAETRLAAFASLGQALSAANTSPEAAQRIVEVADQLLGWDACICHLYSPEHQVMRHVLSMDVIAGRKTVCPATHDGKPPTALIRRAIHEGGFVMLRDQPTSMRADGLPFGDTSRPSASLIFVPMRNAQRVIGVLSIQSYTVNAYDQTSLETLQALADHCGGALDRIQSQESLSATQEQLRQAQKMEAIGQLAGGVAHDFNNLLAVIRGNAELAALQDQGTSKGVGECLNQITLATDRAANLARQLLTFSRKQLMQAEPLCLDQLVQNLARMLKRVISEAIELQCHCDPALPLVKADPGMIEQVLMNLAVNSRDAMPQGGRLQITTGRVHLDANSAASHPDGRVGEFVTIAVHDTGSGIAPEHLPHLFEPFFTTKEPGKGTGLGLATAYGIVKQHQGWLEVLSQPGAGSTFKIFLPAMPLRNTTAAPPPAAPARAHGTETILLVEDEGALRAVIRRLLEKHGYQVFEASSSKEALQVWENRAPADLLLTDVIMPGGVNGRQLASELCRKKPALKVVYMSGYAGEALGRGFEAIRQQRHSFIQKPFAPATLLQTVRESLDGAMAV